jgi:hypothetical protein
VGILLDDGTLLLKYGFFLKDDLVILIDYLGLLADFKVFYL